MKVILTESQIKRVLEQKNDLTTSLKEMGFVPSGNGVFKHSQKPELTVTLAGDVVIVKNNGQKIAEIKTSDIEDLEGTIKSTSLKEQVIQGDKNDPYEYKKEGDTYYAKKKESSKWIKTSGKVSDAIKTKIFSSAKPKEFTPYKLSQNTFDSNRYQRDTFEPYAQQNIKQKNAGEIKAQQFAKGIVPMKKESFINIPPQYRIFSEFLRLRKSPVTTKDFTDKELKTMKAMIEKTKPTSVPKNVDFYKLSKFSFDKMKDGKEDYLGKDIMKNIALTIGNASVSDKGNYYQVDDIYDFNNFNEHPENYTLEKMPETISGAFKKIFSGNLVQGVEEMASYYQKLGYKGIPVSIQIPKNLA
jgi:hypothetical protein